MSLSLQNILKEKERRLKILFVSPFTPRECGIATYTSNLANAINVLNPSKNFSVFAMEDLVIPRSYSKVVKKIIPHKNIKSYHIAAQAINASKIDIVSIQHEYGLYGGECGDYILELAQRIKKPFVITFHTVLSKPTECQKKIIQKLAGYSKAVIVMAKEAEKRLLKVYSVEAEKIIMIPHGVPDFVHEKKINYKEQLGYPDAKVISIFGLLSRNKGIEYVIEALPEVVKKIPQTLFLIIGKTHPVISRLEGESYRAYLELLVRRLGMTDNIRFVNKYLSHDEIMFYLDATDIYVTPYLEKEQITSGTLAYALGAGKPIISTPYAYARELLGGGRGVLVPFKDSSSIANALVGLFLNNDELKKLSRKSYLTGRKMIWENVAHQHLNLFSEIV